MNALDELFLEIEHHGTLRAHADLIRNAKAEYSELEIDRRSRETIISLLDQACEKVDINPVGLTVVGKIDYLVNKINDLERMQDAAISYEIMPQRVENGRIYGEITVQKRPQMDGSVKWAVYQRSTFVLNKDMQWEFEPIPSSRDDEFLARTRFDTLLEAWNAARVMKRAY